jgi:PPOX class probable F420-dependent enzyme
VPALLAADQRALLDEQRRATLATIGPDGRPRLVPCCFALLEAADEHMLVTPIDEKLKESADPRTLARIRDIERDPRMTLLVDRWDEDWSRLAWLRLDGVARLVWPGDEPNTHQLATAALRGRYPQYQTHALESLPLIVLTVTSVRGWTASPA